MKAVTLGAVCIAIVVMTVLYSFDVPRTSRERGVKEGSVGQELSDASETRKAALRSATPIQDFVVVEPVNDTLVNAAPGVSLAEFILLALFQTDDQRAASAVILTEGVGAYRYKVGDVIAEGVHIVAILTDRVLVQLSDRVDVIRLAPFESLAKLTDEYESVGRMVVQRVGDTADADERGPILKQFDLYPVAQGMANGYIVGENFPERITEQAGIEIGDVIVSVNGYPVGEPDSDRLAQISFQDTMRATVVLSRKGQEVIINYPDDIKERSPGMFN